jgi:putative endonuclease
VYSIYAIYNTNSDKIYVGQTKNLAERLKLHNDRTFKSYTSRFPGKWELIYRESAATRLEALQREKQLKSHRGRDFIKQFIPEFRQPPDQR